MRITIHQPAFIPWLGLMSKIQQSDFYVCLDHVQYSKNSFDNRNKVMANKKEKWLTIPIETKGKFKNNPLNEAKVADMGFRDEHWFTLEHYYSKTDNRGLYHDLEKMYNQRYTKLFDWQDHSMRLIREHLGIGTPVLYSSNMGITTTGTNALYEICMKLNATEYLSGPMGKDYLDEPVFARSNIKVKYHKWNTNYPLSAIHYMLTLDSWTVNDVLTNEYEIQ